MLDLDLSFLSGRKKPAPHYLSYPISDEWKPIPEAFYEESLALLKTRDETTLALYIHIPFCTANCSYCLCSAILNRNPEKEAEYVYFLEREIDLLLSRIDKKCKISSIYIGGGTPIKLSHALLTRLMEKVLLSFSILPEAEIKIEIDPQLIALSSEDQLSFIKSLGFNRVSFGVQEIQPVDQEATNKYSSKEMTLKCFSQAKDNNLCIDLDLFYGLPFETLKSFSELTHNVIQLIPDRISLFSYAKIAPSITTSEKSNSPSMNSSQIQFRMYSNAREYFIHQGYLGIGMDQFALKKDSMSLAYLNKKLQRNCLGYTINPTDELISIGVSSQSFFQNRYTQNHDNLTEYYKSLDKRSLPVSKGHALSSEDILRKWIIHQIMCNFQIDKNEFFNIFQIIFDNKFSSINDDLLKMEMMGFLENTNDYIYISGLGELFIRVIAMAFDSYLSPSRNKPKNLSSLSF
ncbi:Oxygen-independent coproporphyrinogen-III oxidase [Candidatus Clavichlamydia salmonicola]|uniref:oxygen-independent coproporphyrinogen III oxidase n=1 Tax=Candidatus Clavichlamydia salmonicola TaxID=469812 RepID=UPI001E60388C|nr:oxygen-independent coproporphyrinogen III oxidase [Candidatus Clavichlamydia salmonicola]MBF5050509.1 Oxygen-independent coproporphyrinogen-III oxidase [Candidatus Clavichlamydia salmonicola]